MNCRWLIAVVPLAACAVTETTCPTGSTLVSQAKADQRAEYCRAHDSSSQSVPFTGRSYEGQIGRSGQPPEVPGGVEGPYTSWYPDGTVASHGGYAIDGTKSVPDGLWAFWYPTGKRELYGLYQSGKPVGCFVSWDASGAMSTGVVQGDQLHVETCTPPPDAEVARIEQQIKAPIDHDRWGDVEFNVVGGTDHFDARNDDPAVRGAGRESFSLAATGRKYFGRLRIGPTFGYGLASGGDGDTMHAGVSVGWQLPAFSSRIDSDVGAELSVERTSVQPSRVTPLMTVARADTSFWSPLPALRADMAILLTPGLAVTLGVRAQGTPMREVDRDVTYCDVNLRCGVAPETWKLGGFDVGAVLGLRVLL